MNIIDQYIEIMQKEAALRANQTEDHSTCCLPLEQPQQMYNITKRIMEITQNSTILRSGNITGGLTKDFIAYESDGGHTNLVRSLVKYALDSRYGWGNSPHNYDRLIIDEAITIHDLPENVTGDIPDNRNRDEAKKNRIENKYFDDLMATYPPSQLPYYWKIKQLLREMQDKSSLEGRILYVADKVSTILMMLYYDQVELYPSISPNSPKISKASREEREFCEVQQDGTILLSELWTVDFLYGRNIAQYDDTGFFLAVLVMMTLIIRGEWYDWREAQYIQ